MVHKTLKYIVSLILVLLISTATWAQDIHFSQFYAAPMVLNPAETGNFDADWRFSNIYRNQWRSIDVPYQTISVGFDRQFFLFTERFSGGIDIVYDHSVDAALTVNKIYISLAYHKKIKENNFHFGIQGGPVLKAYNIDNLTFPSQWDRNSGSFNSSLPNNVANNNDNLAYADINAGVIWSRNFGRIKPHIGYSAYHINYPKESFLETENKLPLRNVAHISALVNINETIFVRPHILYMGHKKATDLILGTNLGMNLPTNPLSIQKAFVGGYFRNDFNFNADATYFVVGLGFKHLEFGLSYDVNISTLKSATSGRGAFEVSVIYKSASTILNKLTVPCNRY